MNRTKRTYWGDRERQPVKDWRPLSSFASSYIIVLAIRLNRCVESNLTDLSLSTWYSTPTVRPPPLIPRATPGGGIQTNTNTHATQKLGAWLPLSL